MDAARIPLTKPQKELLSEFYKFNFEKVIFSKSERNEIWKCIKNDEKIPESYDLKKCPALMCEVEKSKTNKKNVQSTVFSECVFAQTFANIFGLINFYNYFNNPEILSTSVINLLNSYYLVPRYIYSNKSKSRLLIQAGGCGGVDSALITVLDNNVFTIEFKEQVAKTTEPDLPKYGENGKLIISNEFKNNYPQFIDMLEEHIGYNVFKNIGHNEGKFSDKSILTAVSDNYQYKKYADIICTEDKNNYLTIIPANQASFWAKLSGEIRTAGRNSYEVWTPLTLKKFISNICGNIVGNIVSVDKDKLSTRKPRGGKGVSGYKINSLFYIRTENCEFKNNKVSFNINNVRQLNPTITAKLYFGDLDINKVKEYYKEEF